jgi:endonuclease G
MTPLLPGSKIREIVRLAVEAGFDQRRPVMLAELHPAYVAGLMVDPTPVAQLMLDLAQMNKDGTIADDVTPLLSWLLTAKDLSSRFPARQKAFDEWAQEVARAAAAQAAPAAPAEVQERILFRNALLPAGFMAGALSTARSVLRLEVPQIDGGEQRLRGSSGLLSTGFGTGWLIGAEHVITNWHVIEARAPGEARPAIEDVVLQAKATRVEFDFDTQNAPAGFTRAIAALAHYDKALDYAILQLAPDPAAQARPPLPLRNSVFAISPEEPFPVNIIQHARGVAGCRQRYPIH